VKPILSLIYLYEESKNKLRAEKIRLSLAVVAAVERNLRYAYFPDQKISSIRTKILVPGVFGPT
jgi:hypothetical protein